MRAQLDYGRTVDAKVSAWIRTHVLLHWMDQNGKAWNVGVRAGRVQRIPAEESGWRDPYDLEWQNRVAEKYVPSFRPPETISETAGRVEALPLPRNDGEYQYPRSDSNRQHADR